MRSLARLLLPSLFFVGCAHSLTHGTIAMKVSDSVAHVSIHGVKPGDTLVLYRNDCTGGGRGNVRTCQRERLSEGRVSNILNEHYSEVQFPAGTKFSEGDFVETR